MSWVPVLNPPKKAQEAGRTGSDRWPQSQGSKFVCVKVCSVFISESM